MLPFSAVSAQPAFPPPPQHTHTHRRVSAQLVLAAVMPGSISAVGFSCHA